MQVVGNGSSEDGESSETVMKNLMENLTDDSIAVIGSIVSEDVINQLGNLGDNIDTAKVSEVVTNLLTELKKVKDEGDSEKIEKEAAAVATVFDTVNKVSDMTTDEAKQVITSVKDSEVLLNTLEKFVDNNPNPLGIETSEDTRKQIESAMEELEISKTDKLYSVVMSFFGYTG
jgi:hypothetical protein